MQVFHMRSFHASTGTGTSTLANNNHISVVVVVDAGADELRRRRLARMAELEREHQLHEQQIWADDLEHRRRTRLHQKELRPVRSPIFSADEKSARYADSLKRSHEREGLPRRSQLVESITIREPLPSSMTREEFAQRYYERAL